MGTFTSKQLLASLGNPAWAAIVGGKPTKRNLNPARRTDWLALMNLRPGFFCPIYVRNPLNTRRHWRAVAADAKRARQIIALALSVAGVPKTLPTRVTMTRYGCRKLDEGCGLNASLKPVRDGVADYFGVDDADARYAWAYRQEPAPVGCYGVRVEIEPTGERQ